jgi:hypothetical protein
MYGGEYMMNQGDTDTIFWGSFALNWKEKIIVIQSGAESVSGFFALRFVLGIDFT